MALSRNLKVAVIGAGPSRGQIDELSEVVTRPDYDLHPGHAELAVVLVHHGGEALDQRLGHSPHAGAIGIVEYLVEVTFNAFNLPDIKLSVSRAGDETRDDDDLGDEIQEGAVCFAVAQTLNRYPRAQREICGFFPGHRQKQ
ncbi:hypothetical protein PUN4_230034 [Paraburkholderia unamae]|nr:hypothetical protein PUN4_230034 [Paraburkholderia unamae]